LDFYRFWSGTSSVDYFLLPSELIEVIETSYDEVLLSFGSIVAAPFDAVLAIGSTS
jgi:hypothetical protein